MFSFLCKPRKRLSFFLHNLLLTVILLGISVLSAVINSPGFLFNLIIALVILIAIAMSFTLMSQRLSDLKVSRPTLVTFVIFLIMYPGIDLLEFLGLISDENILHAIHQALIVSLSVLKSRHVS